MSSVDRVLSDVLCSIYATALLHYRRGTICKPLPPEFSSSGTEDGRALSQLHATTSVSASLDSPLLSWLRSARRRCSPSRLVVNARTYGGGPPSSESVVDMEEWLRTNLPAYRALKSDSASELPAPDIVLCLTDDIGGSIPPDLVAFHGTSSENVHCILASGLKSLSGTRKERNGAIFGDGVYFTSSPAVALSFARAQPTWGHSQLFSPSGGFRAVFACGLDAKTVGRSNPDLPVKDPSNYIIAQHESQINIRYLLLYVEPAVTGTGLQQMGVESSQTTAAAVEGGAGFRLSAGVVYSFYIVVLLAVWYAKNR